MARLYKSSTGIIACTTDSNTFIDDSTVGIGNWCIVEDSVWIEAQGYNDNSLVDGVFTAHNIMSCADCLCELDVVASEHRNAGMTISVLNSSAEVDHTYLIQTDKASLGMMAAYTTETVINGLVDVEWEFADGTFETFLVQDFKQLFKIVTKYMRDNYANKRVLKAAIEAAQDPETVDLDVGWVIPEGSYTGTGL